VIKLVTIPQQARTYISNLPLCLLSDNEKAFFHYFSLDLICFDKREEIPAAHDVWGVEVE